MKKFFRTVLVVAFGLIAVCPTAWAQSIEADKSSAVIFAYQRVGEDQVQDGNLSLEEFDDHIQELKTGAYNILPVPEIVQALKDHKELPPNTMGITFEGAFRTTLKNVMPRLQAANIPFTLFLSPDTIDTQTPAVLSWDELKTLKKNKLVSFGITSAAYVHMSKETAKDNETYINRSLGRVREMLDITPALFSYPFGEVDAAVKQVVAKYNFSGAFGQQSGAAYGGSDFLALPRFVMTEPFGDIDRFKLTARALPLPVSDVVPDNTTLTSNPPNVGFTLGKEIKDTKSLSCFASEFGKVKIHYLGDNRIEIRLKEPFTEDKARVNCTLPIAPIQPGQGETWRWLGFLFVNSAAQAQAIENDDIEQNFGIEN